MHPSVHFFEGSLKALSKRINAGQSSVEASPKESLKRHRSPESPQQSRTGKHAVTDSQQEQPTSTNSNRQKVQQETNP
jgi:hypothetical protein